MCTVIAFLQEQGWETLQKITTPLDLFGEPQGPILKVT